MAQVLNCGLTSYMFPKTPDWFLNSRNMFAPNVGANKRNNANKGVME